MPTVQLDTRSASQEWNHLRVSLFAHTAPRPIRTDLVQHQPPAPQQHDDKGHEPPRDGAEDSADAPTFEALGVAPDLVAVLTSAGITEPFPIQRMSLPDALAGRDICGKARTGSGKTLAFGLPLIERTETARRRRPHALVLVPTRELANQVTEALTPLAAARGLWICAIYGGVSMSRQIKALHAGVDIVIATPGRLNDLLERGELSLADVSFVVLDEADQMADMGFLPQVERILRQVEGEPQTLLFSATLDGAVGALVRRYQHDPVNHEVESDSPTVDTLEQRFIGVDASDKVPVTVEICAGAQRALVFVRTTRAADRLAKRLSESGLRAAAIHGRLSQNKRERTLASFVSGATPVLVATNLAARGLHVDGVDVVIHFDPPEDSKTYLHRSGRTARAGESGMVVTLVLPEQHRDIIQLQRESGTRFAIVEMRSDDKRLADLASWEPPARSEEPEHGREGSSNFAGRRPAGAGSGRSRPSGSRGGRRRGSRGDGRSRAQATG
jgi:superfamily II DNA/RNA helicase